MKQILSLAACLTFIGCQNGQLTPQAQAVIATATPIAKAAIIAAAASKGVPPSDTTAVLAAVDSIWGAYVQAQNGQPVAQGATSATIGQAIAANIPAGTTPAQATALLQKAAESIPTK